MTNLFTKRKKIALTMLVIWGNNMLIPALSYALTSGPAQPETKGFQVAGVADMVDLQSGDLKYNIPLLDIDGYPINLSYQSGTGIDDEASWVGLGWSLNPGAINRQVRGIPDDFSGDLVETDHYVKPKVTVGGRLTAKVEFKGIAHPSGSFTFGVFSDNYTGIGAELGANAGISYAFANDGFLTAGLGAGVLSNTQSGVDASVSPYVSLSIKSKSDDNLTVNAGLSGSFGYNTRSGLKALTLGQSFGVSKWDLNEAGDGTNSASASYSVSSSSISYNTPPISPTIQIPYTSDYSSFSFDVGGEAFALYGSVGGTGYKNVRQVKNVINQKPAFGFLYAERGMNNADAVMDFIREKDNPVIPNIPNIALPVHTPDMWSYTSQAGGGQFRLYRATGAFFDNSVEDVSTVSSNGGDLGVGVYAHGGYTRFDQHAKTTTRKWTGGNTYLSKGDFQQASTTLPGAQQVYFRQTGEKNAEDADMDTQELAGTQALAVDVNGVTATANFRNANNLNGWPNFPVNTNIVKTSRRPNRTMISYLTAAEAAVAGLDKTIPNYDFMDPSMDASLPAEPIVKEAISRVDPANAVRKPHHFSEITVTDDGGKRMVYGLPVYNISQDEYSFAVDTLRDANHLVNTLPNLTSPMATPSSNNNGVDNFYHKEHKPAYATSFLLSAILSPDYVDKTGDGITDDDLGTAIKFNYAKLAYNYKWRTPYIKATANRGLLADPQDDKGSIVYGEKEIWYVQSIESKTKIAYFITGDRKDGLGVTDWLNGGRDAANKQKCLQEIRLYSKADMTRPIKVVKFQYDYELCRGIPNSADVGSTDPTLAGKLTLKKVWFEYGNSDKGKYHPYVFQYNTTTSHYSGGNTPKYAYNITDRWGTYKPAGENANHLDNEQYPYTNQDPSFTNENAALWHLSTINLPTGGTINVSYESGDYAYVQNQRAMVMNPVGLIDGSGTAVTSLTQARGLSINIGADPPSGADPTAWFKKNLLDGSDYIYTKMGVKMATNNLNDGNPMPYDFVPAYSLVQSVTVTAGIAKIQLVPITESGVLANPISISAWQRLKNEYPRYAYPGFENRVQSGDIGVLAAVSAIVNAAKNLTELKKSFYQKARDKGYASVILPNQSFAKITRMSGFKLGGGCRVKKIQISDNWTTSTNPLAQTAAYGQAYTYTTIDNGQTISSGVATYEPAVGNDENALKQPVPYIEHIKGAINNYFDLELPFGESFYPAPSVGYSKVTVNDLDASGSPSAKTGYVVNEFYTAKDYPVKVTVLPIKSFTPKTSNYYSLTRTQSDDQLSLSQGYCIEVNDMHGKPKATRVFNQAGAEISSTVYSYNSVDNGGMLSLNNKVKVIDPATLQLTDKILGRDVDFFTDFREQETNNNGRTINIGADVFPIPPFLPFFALPHNPKNDNNEHKLFRSACAVKVVQNYGILNKVVKTENGSSIATENVAYDGLTGEALVTRTKNEFKKDIYTTNIPAYWAYKGMGGAYQNLGVLISGLATNVNGEITNYAGYLRAGDEIVDVSNGEDSGTKYWVIYNQAASGTGNTQKLIARDGTLKTSLNITLAKIVRSGHRNMLGASTTTLASLNSPFTSDGHLQLISSGNLATALKVINASATTFDESWGMKPPCPTAPTLPIVENTTLNWHMRAGVGVPASGAYACVDTEANQYTSDLVNHLQCNIAGSFFNGGGRLAASNIYPVESSFSVNYVINTAFTVSESKTYYVGTGRVSGALGFIFDCFDDGITYTSSTNQWTILPVFLTAGTHILTMSIPYIAGSENAFGLEVYDNTLSEIRNAGSGSGINVIYSTAQLRGNMPLQSSTYDASAHLIYHYQYTDGSPMSVCPVSPQPAIVNPYTTGFLGNYRPYQTKVFQQTRSYGLSTNLNSPVVDVKNAGFINDFYAYWYFNSGSWTANPNGTRWVTANTVNLYDKYGQQLENKDALGRFSAAKFDFNGELPSAVASNAMNREIYAASLEDNRFVPGSSADADICNIREFIQPSNKLSLKQLAVNTISHSGNYSALLPGEGVTMATIFHTLKQKENPYLMLDAQKQYITQTTAGLYPNGFEPYTGHQYIFNAWVNDASPNDRTVNLVLSINGQNVGLRCKAVVEGWKLIEGTMDLSTVAGATALNIAIVPSLGKTIYIDDIRMHPFDAHMKTYAYDDKTMRLMAEIDENGFATFYEYDDEGLLIRVKKETEKGIMTLKESRSTYRFNNTP